MAEKTVDYGESIQGNAMEQVPGNDNDYFRNYLICSVKHQQLQ